MKKDNQNEHKEKYGKIVLIGPTSCGKTCLLSVYKDNTFPRAYIPTIIESFQKRQELDNDHVNLNLWDTTGQDPNPAVRTSTYANADVFFICCSLDYKYSYLEVHNTFLKEAIKFGPKDSLKYLLVLKWDLSENMEDWYMDMEDMEDLMNFKEFDKVFKVSAIRNENVFEPFLCAGKHILEKKARVRVVERKSWFRRCFCCGE